MGAGWKMRGEKAFMAHSRSGRGCRGGCTIYGCCEVLRAAAADHSCQPVARSLQGISGWAAQWPARSRCALAGTPLLGMLRKAHLAGLPNCLTGARLGLFLTLSVCTTG